MKMYQMAALLVSALFASQVHADDCLKQYETKIASLKAAIASGSKPLKVLSANEKSGMIVAGSPIAGCAMGAGIGALAGGVGAVPGCVAGATYGGTWGEFWAGMLITTGYNDWSKEASDKSSFIEGERSELESIESAYYILREATVYKAPGTVTEAVLNSSNSNGFPLFDQYADPKNDLVKTDQVTDQRFIDMIARGNATGLFCDAQGNVDGIDKMVSKIQMIADNEQENSWSPAAFTASIGDAKVLQVDTDSDLNWDLPQKAFAGTGL